MNSITTDRLTSKYLRSINRYNLMATIFAIVFTVAAFCWMLLSHNASTQLLTSALVYLVALFLAVFWILQSVWRARFGPAQPEARFQLAWLVIGLGLLANFFSYFMLANPSLNGSPFWIIFSNICYPLTFLGLLILPGPLRLRVSMIFDVLIITVCFVGLCWLAVVSMAGPDKIAHAARNDGVVLTYPGGDIFLLLIVVLLLRQGIERTARLALYLIGASFLLDLCAHVSCAYATIFSISYHDTSIYINVLWVSSFLLLGLASLYHYAARAHNLYNDGLAGLLAFQMPAEELTLQRDRSARTNKIIQITYISLCLLMCLLIIFQGIGHYRVTSNFIVITASCAALVLIRHFFSARETEALLQEREQRFKEAEHVRHLVEKLSDIRDLEQLRERISATMLSEFGFTFAMLVLVEEHNVSLTQQSHLLVSTTSPSAQSSKWRLAGDNILFRTVHSGKKAVVNWPQHREDTPAEVLHWQDKQHVPAMLFFPIIYQDKILGSLGVARHALSRRHQSEMALIRIYTEQIGGIIEHAHLYREARDHEAFARAMANISTRLNAAVVELDEISQLICDEGAHALRADYAVLYITHEEDMLVPLAASRSEEPATATPHQWPVFSSGDYEAETANARQPFLLDITQRRKARQNVVNLQEVMANVSAAERGYFGPHLLPLRTKFARHFIQTAILAPLVAGGKRLGILIFARSTLPGTNNEQCFDASDLAHAQDFVEQAAVAFANAQLYQRLRTAHERLQDLDQLKDQFMITASHELRTPLTAVQGYIELIAQYDDILPSEQRREFLQKAQRGCEELAILLRNVMDASRLEVEAGIKPALISRVSVLEMIAKVQMMIEPQVTHEMRDVQVTIPPHFYVFADPVRLHQVLMNISTNALKYSPPGSPIFFAAHLLSEQGFFVTIDITDKGKGITPEDQGQLFQRFVRLESDLNSPVRGTGLGLYISRRLIEAMGGKIWIKSKGVAGEGSTFHIQLPMA